MLPLRPLENDPDHRHLGSLDEVVSITYHGDGKPTPYIPECLRVGFPPLGGEVASQVLQCGLCLGDQKAVK